MITNDQIAQGAVTETKLSKNLRLSHTNLAAVEAGQVLVGNDNGDLSAATMSGDVTISSTGATTLTDDSVLDVVKRLKVIRKQDFSQNNTMLFASHAGQPRAVNINELKILLGIPTTFNSSESEVAYERWRWRAGEGQEFHRAGRGQPVCDRRIQRCLRQLQVGLPRSL